MNIGDTSMEYDGIRSYFRNVRRIPLLSDKEEKIIIEKIKKGDNTARAELAQHNLPLAINIATKYRSKGVRISFIDMIQAGNEGLVIASQKFDPSQCKRFSTYATWWIRGCIQELFRNNSSIKISEYYSRLMVRYKKAKRELTQLLNGKQPTTRRIAKKIGVSLKTVSQIEDYIKLSNTPSMSYISNINKFVNPKANPEQQLKYINLANGNPTGDLLKKLTKRERELMRFRFGVNDGHLWTIKEIAKKFGVTKEEIQQMEKSLLEKLGSPELAKEFNNYILSLSKDL